MPSLTATEFYCDGGLIELADIDSGTSEATGYPKEHLLDGSLITGWKGTSSSAQEIIIDLNQTPACDTYGFGYFVRNYMTDHNVGADGYLEIYTSANGTDWGSYITYAHLPATGITCDIVKVTDTEHTAMKRYLKFRFLPVSPDIMDIGHLFITQCFSGFDASGTCQLPRQYGDNYSLINNAEGRSSLRRYIPTLQEIRKYTILSSTTYAIWQGLKDASQGGNRLVVMVDWIDGVEQTPVIVRLGDIVFTQTTHDMWDITVQITRQPYIHPTYGY